MESRELDSAYEKLSAFYAGTRARGGVIHGSANALAGQGKANPIGMIMAAAMMLEHSFGMARESGLLRRAIDRVLADGYRTGDIHGRGHPASTLVGTAEMTDRIVDALHRGS